MTNEQLREVKMAWARGEEVQYLGVSGWHDWESRDCINLGRAGATKWRIKTKTIQIGEYDVPEPLREMTFGQIYWIANPTQGVFFAGTENIGECMDKKWLSLGLCHATLEAAEIHTKALLSFTEQK